LVQQAAREGRPVTGSLAAAQPRVVDTPAGWYHATNVAIFAPKGQFPGRGGIDSLVTHVPPGDYTAWLQGSYGPGVRLTATTAGKSSARGEVRKDLGYSHGWSATGDTPAGGRGELT